MMAAPVNKKKSLMDVAKPGDTVPDSSSRPVIVTHKPMIKDPMVSTDANEAEPTPAAQKPIQASKNRTIAPINEDTAVDATETKEDVKEDDQTISTSETAAVDAVAGQAAEKTSAAKVSEAEREKQAAIEKAIEDKKYFVHISFAHKKGVMRGLVVATVMILLAAAVGGLLAIDAELISTDISLPFDLVK
jgi:hypothetical protein